MTDRKPLPCTRDVASNLRFPQRNVVNCSITRITDYIGSGSSQVTLDEDFGWLAQAISGLKDLFYKNQLQSRIQNLCRSKIINYFHGLSGSLAKC